MEQVNLPCNIEKMYIGKWINTTHKWISIDEVFSIHLHFIHGMSYWICINIRAITHHVQSPSAKHFFNFLNITVVTVIVTLSNLCWHNVAEPFTACTPQKVLAWDLAVRCIQCSCAVLCSFDNKHPMWSLHLSKDSSWETMRNQRRGKEGRRWEKGRRERLNLLPPVNRGGEWHNSVHCKWKMAMKSRQGRLARAVKTFYIWCSSLLLKADPELEFEWQQIVSKLNCVGRNFQIRPTWCPETFSILTWAGLWKSVHVWR